MKLLDIRWFNGQTLIGVARTEDEWEGIKYYIRAIPNSTTPIEDAQLLSLIHI